MNLVIKRLDSRRLAQLLIELRKWAQFKVWLSGAEELKRLPAWELERLVAEYR